MTRLIPAALLALAPLLSSAALPERPETVRFTFEFAPRDSGTPPKGSLTLRPVSFLGDPLVLATSTGSPVTADLPPRTSWELSVEVPGYWSPREILSIGEAGGTSMRRVSLWPTGKISGTLKLAGKGESLPKELAVTIQPPPLLPRKDAVPEGTVTCPVEEKGSWTCEVPAATLDLALRAAGFVPHYRWDVSVQPAKVSPVGTLELKKGASVAGWVEVEGGALAPGECTARLSPLVAPGSGASIAARLQSTAVRSPVGKTGFFQIGGVAPGSYLLEVEQPGYAPARLHPVEVLTGTESFLKQPLVLRRPLQVEISVRPALDPLGRPWRVKLRRASDFTGAFHDSAFDGPADETGLVTVPGQSPGRFSLSVSDSLENRFESIDFVVDGPENARREIDVHMILLRGKVSLGDDPLKATLHFGGARGAVRVSLEADEDGTFEGVLPRAGRWSVDVQAAEPGLETRAAVEVRPDGDGRAFVEIELPDTKVFGKVVDEAGRPVPRASILVSTEEGHPIGRSGEDGAFEVRGAPEGAFFLSAERFVDGKPRVSDWLLLSLQEGQPLGPVELRLRDMKEVKGRVQSPRGPVVGASISLLTHRPMSGGGGSTRTDLSGSFSSQVPAKAQNVVAVVSPPGHALKAYEFPADGIPVALNVPPEGGTLEVSYPYSEEEVRDGGLMPWVFQNDLPLPLSSLHRWAWGHGVHSTDLGSQKFPNLAPGTYRVCMAPRAVLPETELAFWIDRQGGCASGYLEAGGNLRLEVRRPWETAVEPGRP